MKTKIKSFVRTNYNSKLWLAVFVITIISILSVGLSFSSAENDKAYFNDENFTNPKTITAGSLEISYDDISYTLTYPFEHSIDRIVKIKNTKNEPIEIDLKSSVNINGTDQELPGWPQPLPTHFEALEEKANIFKAEFSNDMLSATENGKTYDYPFKITINRKDKLETPIQFTLSNKVFFLSKDQNVKSLPTNAKISGRVLDETTNKPIENARIRILSDLPIGSYEGQGDSSGNFSVSVPAYQRKLLQNWIEYNIVVEKEGYENFNLAVAPKENEELKVEVKMKVSNEKADYSLIKKYDTGLPTARVDFSADGKYFATTPFHSGEKIDFIKANAYLHLFDTESNLVCRYKLDNESPTVSISSDGGMIATVYRPAIDNWMGGDDVVLLDNSCKELWRYSGAKTDDGGPSEVKISPDGKYIAAGTFDGRVYLLDIQNKKMLWNYATGNGQVRHILFNEDSSGVYFGSDPNLFHYKINGDFDWKTNIGSWPYSMDLSSNYIFVGVKAGRFLSLINKTSGDILWRYPIGARPDNMLISPDESYFIYQTSNGNMAIRNAVFDVSGNLLFNLPVAHGGMITDDSEFIVYYNGNSVDLVNRRGNKLWQYQLDPPKWPSPRGAVHISKDKTKIIVADAFNGNVYFFQGGISGDTSQSPPKQVSKSFNWKSKNIILLSGLVILFILAAGYLTIRLIKIKRKNAERDRGTSPKQTG